MFLLATAYANPPTCPTSLASLSGTTWVSGRSGTPEPRLRVRFHEGGGRADYTAGSLSDVYTFDCSSRGETVRCVEHDAHLDDFARAWVARPGRSNAGGLATILGVPVAEVAPLVKQARVELAKLTPEEARVHRARETDPANPIRAVFEISLGECAPWLTIRDRYLTLADGELRELDTMLGTSRFALTAAPYLFETCTDVDSAWAPGPGDAHLPVQPAGDIRFSAIVQASQRGAANCSWDATTYVDWLPAAPPGPPTIDRRYGTRWDFTTTLGPGRHVVLFDRVRTCDGTTTRVGLTCAAVRVE